MDSKPATLMDVKNFFGIERGVQFRAEWSQLDQSERDAIRLGIGNGTFTY
jgi:uncharacterized protein YhbP (UPF0306 family)